MTLSEIRDNLITDESPKQELPASYVNGVMDFFNCAVTLSLDNKIEIQAKPQEAIIEEKEVISEV